MMTVISETLHAH